MFIFDTGLICFIKTVQYVCMIYLYVSFYCIFSFVKTSTVRRYSLIRVSTDEKLRLSKTIYYQQQNAIDICKLSTTKQYPFWTGKLFSCRQLVIFAFSCRQLVSCTDDVFQPRLVSGRWNLVVDKRSCRQPIFLACKGPNYQKLRSLATA